MQVPPRYLTSQNDYRSDTFTLPTREVWNEVFTASMGDMIYEEDTDIATLEERLANHFAGGSMYGGVNAAAMFCPSTTMSNQVGICALLNQAPPYSILCDKRSHVYVDECAGLSVLSRALVIPILPSNSHMLTLDSIKSEYFPDIGDVHIAPTKLIVLENTLHGMIFPYDELSRISHWAHDNGILLHLDGARLWNAAAAFPDPVEYIRKVCQLCDSVSFCFSKSIGAPIGSMLIGKEDVIRRARVIRKQQGGGMRQAGFLARMANYCIDKNFPGTIAEVTRATKYFWERLYNEVKTSTGRELYLRYPVETNFIFVDLEKSGIALEKLLEFGEKNGVRLFDGRLSFHHQNIGEGLQLLLQTFIDVAKYTKQNCQEVPATMHK